jgi:hypothetical protein
VSRELVSNPFLFLILSSSFFLRFYSPKFFLPDDYGEREASREQIDENRNHTSTHPNDFHLGFKLFLDEHRAKMAAIAAAANTTTTPTIGV